MLETKKSSSVDNTFGLAKSLMVFHLIDSHLKHFVFKKPLSVQETENLHIAMFGMGCFWGVEKMFWGIDGVSMTAVGYSAGLSDFPDYKSVCSRTTGHSEVVLIHFQPDIISFPDLLTIFWESHDPTQGMKQGADIGTQYRSIIITYSNEQYDLAIQSKIKYSRLLKKSGCGEITTEITNYINFYYAEDYHQQYLSKNPNGYCSMSGTGISYL